jgi:hypothetical protein
MQVQQQQQQQYLPPIAVELFMSQKKTSSYQTSPPSPASCTSPLGRAKDEKEDDHHHPEMPSLCTLQQQQQQQPNHNSTATTVDECHNNNNNNNNIQYAYDPGDFLRTSARLMLQEAPFSTEPQTPQHHHYPLPQKPTLVQPLRSAAAAAAAAVADDDDGQPCSTTTNHSNKLGSYRSGVLDTTVSSTTSSSTTSINRYSSYWKSITSMFHDKIQPETHHKASLSSSSSSSSSSSHNSSRCTSKKRSAGVVPMIHHSNSWNNLIINHDKQNRPDSGAFVVSNSVGRNQEPFLNIASWPMQQPDDKKSHSVAVAASSNPNFPTDFHGSSWALANPTITGKNDPFSMQEMPSPGPVQLLGDSFLPSLFATTTDKYDAATAASSSSSSSSVTLEEIIFKRKIFGFLSSLKDPSTTNDSDDDFHLRIQKLKPLNAYNYFFRDERDNLVLQRKKNRTGTIVFAKNCDEEKKNQSFPYSSSPAFPSTAMDRSESKKWKLLYQRWCHDPCKPKRKHRKIQEETLPFVT